MATEGETILKLRKFLATGIFQKGFSAKQSFQKLVPVLGSRKHLKRDGEVLRQYFGSKGGKALLLVTHSPAAVLGGQKGRVYPESVLSRILFATRYVRRLDKHGFLRFADWKFYGERGLPRGAKVTIWIYEGTLKVEHQAVTLSEYEVSMFDDRKRVQAVRSARTHQTPFRSPQLTLFDLGPDEWLLYWKTPEYVPAQRRRRVPGMVQLPLFEQESLDLVVGADTDRDSACLHTHLHLMGEPTESQETEK
jgi:hypothetical protein